jgi:Protein of unknown function (DUF3228)
MQIAMTQFALRNWDAASGSSTHIDGISPDELVRMCNQAAAAGAELVPGYAPFCCHLFLSNPTPTKCGFAPITDDNRHLLRSGYRSRRDGELPVLERWFEELSAPTANYFDVILYSHAQLVKEAAAFPEQQDVPDCDWGIVSIIGTLVAAEPPMPPITQMRNALGAAEGGSGAALDHGKYAQAAEFWEQHAAVR